MADANDILLAVGRLQASVDHLRHDFINEKSSATESRRALYIKHDELQEQISTLNTDLRIAGQITAQVRDEVKTVSEKVDQHKLDIQPSIDDWRKIKTLGLGITGVLAIGGLTVGALLSMGWDAFRAALRSWLG